VNLLLLRFEFLVRPAREIGPDGDRRAALRNPVYCVIEIPAQLLAFRERTLVRLGERLALTLEFRDLPLVVAPDHRDTTPHVHRQGAEIQFKLGRSRLGRRGGCWHWCRSVLLEPERGSRTG